MKQVMIKRVKPGNRDVFMLDEVSRCGKIWRGIDPIPPSYFVIMIYRSFEAFNARLFFVIRYTE